MSAFGFLVSGITGGRAVPDRGFTRSSKPAVLHVKFGDGYEQRASDGINSVKEEYNFNFTNRNKFTFLFINFDISLRADSPIFFRLTPLLPTKIYLCDFFVICIVW